MRHLLSTAAAVLFTLPACSAADDKSKAAPPPAAEAAAQAPKMLTIGDPAPPLKVAEWVKTADPVKAFEPGKVYVVDFWATWCGPCIQAMPHMNVLVNEYKEQGLRAVLVTAKDERGNTLDRVKEYVAGRGSRYNFAWAFCDTDDTHAAYMEAAGRGGIPCSFVIDKAGKIAFIGHPAELDDVLPRVVAGTWKGKADVDAIREMNEELDRLTDKPGEAVAALPAFEKKYPDKAKQSGYKVQKAAVLLQAGQIDAAKAVSEGLLKTGVEKKDGGTLNFVRGMWSAKQLNPDRKHIDLAVKAAEEVLKVEGESDLSAVLGAAQTYYAAGNKEKGQEYAEKALKLAGDDKRTKEQVEKVLKSFQE